MWVERFSRRWLWRMPSSGLLRHVALVRTDVSEEPNSFIIRVTIIGELGTTLAVTSNWRTLRRRRLSSLRSGHLGFLRIVRRLLVTADVVPSLPILVTLMMEALGFSWTSVLSRAIRRNIPKDGILQQHGQIHFPNYIIILKYIITHDIHIN
jgi:hypothetical protein